MHFSKGLVLVTAVGAVTAVALLTPAEAFAQRRAVVRPTTRHMVVVAARPYRPYYYNPFFYGPYGGWYSGWYGGGPYYQRYPYPYPYPAYYVDNSSAARLQVQPREAEVFVDGHFVGTVDNFDGWTQRLRVAPGERQLEIYLDGYRTFRRHVLFRPGATISIRHDMEPLAPGDAPEARPAPDPSAAPQRTRPGQAPPAPGRAPARPESREYGALEIRVQPADAEVFVNGERWESPDQGVLSIELAGGLHRVEVQREGYRTYSAEVRVVAGEVTTLNVSLSR